jgi:hypothetical protein
MDNHNLRFDEDRKTLNFGQLIEFDELDETDSDPELFALMSRVQAARLAGA